MPEPKINKTQLAAQYGFAMAVLNSNPELKRIFEKAVKNTWSPERFQAAVRNTKWYKKTSEARRNAQILKNSDPATYKAELAQVRLRLKMTASQLGAVVTNDILDKMAVKAYEGAWDDNQVQANLANYVKYTDGRLLGQAGQWEQELRDYAGSMGMTYSRKTYQSWVRSIAEGNTTLESIQAKIRESVASAYPHLADRLREGETIETISDPYRQTAASLLELNPDSLTMKDPLVKRALAVTNDKGVTSMQTLYDFENEVRKDARWRKTQNAQDAGMAVVNRVLGDMGILG